MAWGAGCSHGDPITLSVSRTVFICSFMVAAPVFGYLGDRFNRKVILSCGIFFWSAVTFSSSFIPQQVSPVGLPSWRPRSPAAPRSLQGHHLSLTVLVRTGVAASAGVPGVCLPSAVG